MAVTNRPKILFYSKTAKRAVNNRPYTGEFLLKPVTIW